MLVSWLWGSQCWSVGQFISSPLWSRLKHLKIPLDGLPWSFVSQRMNRTDSGWSPDFSSSAAMIFVIWIKCPDKYWMDCDVFWFRYSYSPQKPCITIIRSEMSIYITLQFDQIPANESLCHTLSLVLIITFTCLHINTTSRCIWLMQRIKKIHIL